MLPFRNQMKIVILLLSNVTQVTKSYHALDMNVEQKHLALDLKATQTRLFIFNQFNIICAVMNIMSICTCFLKENLLTVSSIVIV